MIVAAALLLLTIAALVTYRSRSGGLAAGGGVNARLAAQVPSLREAYIRDEGHANRGPKFQQLALALNHKLLVGQPMTEVEMVQTLGPPNLMQRDAAGRGSFAYFYDRFGENDWVVHFDYLSGSLWIGFNGVSANPETYASMRPYVPPSVARQGTPGTEPSPGDVNGSGASNTEGKGDIAN